MEKYGSGIKRIHTICKDCGLIPPKINIKSNSFEVILYKEKLNNVVNNVVNDRSKEVLKLIKSNKYISASQIAKALKISSRTAQRCIKQLRDKNYILRIGDNKTGYWELVNK